MSISGWIVLALAAFDLLLCIVLYFIMRGSRKLNRNVLLPLGAGMSAFAFHAVMFFHSAFLVVQLATLSALFGIVLLEVRRRQAPL